MIGEINSVFVFQLVQIYLYLRKRIIKYIQIQPRVQGYPQRNRGIVDKLEISNYGNVRITFELNATAMKKDKKYEDSS